MIIITDMDFLVREKRSESAGYVGASIFYDVVNKIISPIEAKVKFD